MIQIESKRKKWESILKKYPDAIIADVTSHAEGRLVKLSPFYPHGGIPVPFGEGVTATIVDARKQGAKYHRDITRGKHIVLLDYNTNCDVDDPKKPLSHAFLIKAYMEGL